MVKFDIRDDMRNNIANSMRVKISMVVVQRTCVHCFAISCLFLLLPRPHRYQRSVSFSQHPGTYTLNPTSFFPYCGQILTPIFRNKNNVLDSYSTHRFIAFQNLMVDDAGGPYGFEKVVVEIDAWFHGLPNGPFSIALL